MNFSLMNNQITKIENKMAGPAGFEPAHARIKTWCLTAWRRPNIIVAFLIYHLSYRKDSTGETFIPFATKPFHFVGSLAKIFSAVCLSLTAEKIQLPLPVNLAGE